MLLRKSLMFRILIRRVLPALFLCLILAPRLPALAQQGTACTGADRVYNAEGPSTYAAICDGSVLQIFRSATGNPVREGIALASPATTLDVNGEVRVGNTAQACAAGIAGA